MERLSDKAIEIINALHTERLDYASEYLPLIDCAHKCAAYEDTCLTPGEIYQQRFLIAAQKDPEKLARLRDVVLADEAGRLVVLPCKVGDTVWFIRPHEKGITETTIEKMVAKGKGLYMKLSCNTMYETSCNSIGKSVFLTRQEAEEALRKEAENG